MKPDVARWWLCHCPRVNGRVEGGDNLRGFSWRGGTKRPCIPQQVIRWFDLCYETFVMNNGNGLGNFSAQKTEYKHDGATRGKVLGHGHGGVEEIAMDSDAS